MIEVLYTDGRVEEPNALTFQQMQSIVGGYVECNRTKELHKGSVVEVQCICNEDGLSLGLPTNLAATKRFSHSLLMSPEGAVGNWIILSGKDMLT